MAEQSTMTIERGLAENVVLTIQNLIKEQTGFTTAVNAWHSKRDASWNVNVYKTNRKEGRQKEVLFDVGKGWDFMDAVEKLRENYLLWASTELGLDEVAKNTFEIQIILDERSGKRRNDVGAVESDSNDFTEWKEAHEALKDDIDELKNDLKTLIQNLK